MVRALMISVTAAFVFAGAWTVNLVCYHPAADEGLNPLTPISMTVAWKQ
jgi:hypothetical protein